MEVGLKLLLSLGPNAPVMMLDGGNAAEAQLLGWQDWEWAAGTDTEL